MAGKVVDTDMGYDALMADLAFLAGSPVEVLVGVHGKTHSEEVVKAASNEFGTEDGHIPERSFLRSTVDDGAAEILDDLQGAVEATLAGGPAIGAVGKARVESVLDRELGRVGAKWTGRVQAKIRSGVEPANATVTVKGAEYVRKSVGLVPAAGAVTLIDQGRMIQSITHVVRRKSNAG